VFILPREHSGRHPAVTHSACQKTPKAQCWPGLHPTPLPPNGLNRPGCRRDSGRLRVQIPVPVVQWPTRVDRAKERLEPVAELTVPGEKLRTSVNAGALLDLVLSEPLGYVPSRRICSRSSGAAEDLIQRQDRIAKPVALLRANRRKASADSVSERDR